MSFRFTAAAWAQSDQFFATELPDGRRLGPHHHHLLLYLADQTHDDTGTVHTGAAYVAAMARKLGYRVHPQTGDCGALRKHLADLAATGWLQITVRKGRQSRYRLTLNPDPRSGEPRAVERGVHSIDPAPESAVPRAGERGNPAPESAALPVLKEPVSDLPARDAASFLAGSGWVAPTAHPDGLRPEKPTKPPDALRALLRSPHPPDGPTTPAGSDLPEPAPDPGGLMADPPTAPGPPDPVPDHPPRRHVPRIPFRWR